jgi:hypothetical protein
LEIVHGKYNVHRAENSRDKTAGEAAAAAAANYYYYYYYYSKRATYNPKYVQ